MLVQYTQRIPETLKTFYFYAKEPIEPCCEEMGEAIRDGFIQFGEYDHNLCNSDDKMNIFKCSPYPEGAVWREMPIKFCPFCGAAILYEEVAE